MCKYAYTYCRKMAPVTGLNYFIISLFINVFKKYILGMVSDKWQAWINISELFSGRVWVVTVKKACTRFCPNCPSLDWILMRCWWSTNKILEAAEWVSAPDRVHLPAGKLLTAPHSGQKMTVGVAWMALTCNCPTPFPHLNALLNHRWGSSYNPVVSLWCEHICALNWPKNSGFSFSGWNRAAFSETDTIILLQSR